MFWPQDPKTSICNRLHAISHVFASNPCLLDFFFNYDRTELRWATASATLHEARLHLDADDVTLVRVALAIWLDSHHAKISDLYRGFNRWHFDDCLRAVEVLAQVQGCECQSCLQRLGPSSFAGDVTSKLF